MEEMYNTVVDKMLGIAVTHEPRLLDDTERLLKAFGLPKSILKEYFLFRIDGTSLYGHHNKKGMCKLAELEHGVFMYNMRQYGLDDKARDKFS